MRGSWFASVSDGLYGQLATKYRTRFGRAPYRLASLGYDSVLLTVRIARDWKPGTNFPVNRLLAADGFGGIDGIFRFNNRGIAQRALEVRANLELGHARVGAKDDLVDAAREVVAREPLGSPESSQEGHRRRAVGTKGPAVALQIPVELVELRDRVEALPLP